ncbi:hypothetical protein ABTX34_30935 [Streptomyces sp. NPDC096538]|uniref:hypothetical protein n=1 Tax=Streptomyces sp. NPDC096538 TaxID=3155427 RepID=UPI003322D8E7
MAAPGGPQEWSCGAARRTPGRPRPARLTGDRAHRRGAAAAAANGPLHWQAHRTGGVLDGEARSDSAWETDS